MGRDFTETVRLLTARHREMAEKQQVSTFAVVDGGRQAVIGGGPPAYTITVEREAGREALAGLDQFQVAEAYLDGSLDIDGDMMAALSMRKFFRDVHPVAYLNRFVKPLLRGQVAADEDAISQHYDEDPDFFLSFLDGRHRCYTHGVFASDEESLEDAMTRKMAYAYEVLGLEPGMELLEVGGGWGAFAEYAAARGVRVTTLTISVESEKFLTELFARLDLPATVVREHLFAYQPGRRFDAIVNMGVTEHLPDYRGTLRAYERLLKPGAPVYLDAVASRRKHRLSTFMSQHIYPGNPSPLVLHSYLSAVAHSPFEVESVLQDRHSYQLTCAEWARRLDLAREFVVGRFGERLYRQFRLFLWGSAASLRAGQLQAYRWTLRLPGQDLSG